MSEADIMGPYGTGHVDLGGQVMHGTVEAFDLLDLNGVEAQLRDDLARFRERLAEARREKEDLRILIRDLVAAEEVIVSALIPFDRRRRKQGDDDGG